VTARRRLLLFGASGQVGTEIRRLAGDAWDLVAPAETAVDFRDHGALRAAVRAARPDVIVNAAAYTAVDRAESEAQLAQAINADAPRVLAEEAGRAGALLVHYSTDYVFDGRTARPYREGDAPAPLSTYGRTKLEGERQILASGCRAVILRTSWVFSPYGQNFLLTMRRLLNEREEVRVVSDQRGAPTAAHALADATLRVLRVGPGPEQCGLYHCTAAGETTWHGFAAAILTRMGSAARCREVTPITTAEYPTPARRPAFSLLDSSRFVAAFGWNRTHWGQQLDEVWARLAAAAG
jgi:dTDP-4-dehydrorhamnose reductase